MVRRLVRPEVRGSDQLIAEDLADQAGALDLRRDVIRQADVLLQIDGGLRQREVIIDAVLEHDPYEGQAVERRGADHVDAGSGGQPNLYGYGVIALHFLRRLPSGLRSDFQDHRRGIWIGLDIEPGEGSKTRCDKYQQAQQDDGPPGQRKCRAALQHKSTSGLSQAGGHGLGHRFRTRRGVQLDAGVIDVKENPPSALTAAACGRFPWRSCRTPQIVVKAGLDAR